MTAQHATEGEAFNAHITLTLKDGTVFDTSAGGSSLSVENGQTTVIDSDLFDRLVRMEDIASVTIGDLTLPI